MIHQGELKARDTCAEDGSEAPSKYLGCKAFSGVRPGLPAIAATKTEQRKA
jgi:hypothetical protein